MARKEAFKAKEILPQVYAISGEMVNRYLVVGKTHALLVDTGYGFSDLRKFVETITKLPLYVVNSHGHVDHAGGNCAFDGPVYIHPEDIPVYRTHQSLEMRKAGLSALKAVQRILFFLRILPKHMDVDKYLNGPLCENFAPVREGHVFDLGGMTAQVVEIPGHTPGSIGLLVKERKLFITSDGINSATWLFLPESCKLSVYQQTLKKADQLDFDYLLTGHSSELLPKSIMKDYIEVAENPDFKNGKPGQTSTFAPGVQPVSCHAVGLSPKAAKKKPTIMISADKF